MLPKAEAAYFAIADISGYTNFLAAVELDHAQDIIADFMDTVVKALRPPFRLAKFEGDAAFVYTTVENIDGSLLQDAIESAYFKFRRRLRSVRQASTCECQACAAMANLDFKFVVHHGEMVKQRMGGREELAGRDVILVHRLLKNSLSEKIGGRAYALYSDAAIRAMGVDPAAQGLISHSEAIDVIGDVTLWARDLEAAWRHDDAQIRNEVTRDEAFATLEFDIAAPRQLVWEYLTVPGQWRKWWDADDIVEESRKGRRGIGTENHCMHGNHTEYRGDARLAPGRLFHRQHRAANSRRAADRDDPRPFGQPGRNDASGIPGRQAEAEGQGVRRGRCGQVRRTHEQGDRRIAVHGGGGATCPQSGGRAGAEAIERTILNPAGESGRVRLKASQAKRRRRHADPCEPGSPIAPKAYDV